MDAARVEGHITITSEHDTTAIGSCVGVYLTVDECDGASTDPDTTPIGWIVRPSSPISCISVHAARRECDCARNDEDTAAIISEIGRVGVNCARIEGHDARAYKDTAASRVHPTSSVPVDDAPYKSHCATIDIDTAASSRVICATIHKAPGDAEPDQLHDARRSRGDVQHTARIWGARLCIQHDRGSHRRLEDDAPGDAELGADGVGAGGEDNAAKGCVGECTGQAGDSAHHHGWRRRGRGRRRGRRWWGWWRTIRPECYVACVELNESAIVLHREIARPRALATVLEISPYDHEVRRHWPISIKYEMPVGLHAHSIMVVA